MQWPQWLEIFQFIAKEIDVNLINRNVEEFKPTKHNSVIHQIFWYLQYVAMQYKDLLYSLNHIILYMWTFY